MHFHLARPAPVAGHGNLRSGRRSQSGNWRRGPPLSPAHAGPEIARGQRLSGLPDPVPSPYPGRESPRIGGNGIILGDVPGSGSSDGGRAFFSASMSRSDVKGLFSTISTPAAFSAFIFALVWPSHSIPVDAMIERFGARERRGAARSSPTLSIIASTGILSES